MTFTPENIFFMGSMLVAVSILISKWGYRFGVPTLLLFLFTGMLFGSDGLGLQFHSHGDAQLIGMMSLSVILIIFTLTDLVHGNGYLAVYVAGLVAGNNRLSYRRETNTFMQGITWLLQIVIS